MKALTLAAGLALVGAGWANADNLVGTTWKTSVDDGKYAHVEFVNCGSKLCAVFRKTFDSNGPYQSTSLGKNLVSDMVAKGDGSYSGGTIWEPSSDKLYKSKMQMLDAGRLQVKGCVAIICKKFVWTKVK
jgi:uncharacterized protein (DUF2147 family)